MTHLIKLDTLSSRLRLKPDTIRRMVNVANSEANSAHVVNLLNGKRRGTQPLVDGIPSDLMTPDEAAKMIYPMELDAKSLLMNKLAQKRGAPIPHFYFSKHAIRFSRAALETWVSSATKRETL